MKKWTKKILVAVLCLMMLQMPAAEPLIAVQTVQAASTAKAAKVKNGLKKEGGQYYYYVKGKKVKNTWKTVTVANKTTGKKMTYRYYFSNTGFNRYAQMVKGVYYSAYGQSRAGFYAFNTKTGVYDARTSSRLRKAFVREKSSAALRKALGRPLRTRKTDGCYGDGQEYLLEYTRFWVNTYKDKKGKEIVLDVISK